MCSCNGCIPAEIEVAEEILKGKEKVVIPYSGATFFFVLVYEACYVRLSWFGIVKLTAVYL